VRPLFVLDKGFFIFSIGQAKKEKRKHEHIYKDHPLVGIGVVFGRLVRR